jgi:hypothetical protein
LLVVLLLLIVLSLLRVAFCPNEGGREALGGRVFHSGAYGTGREAASPPARGNR